MGIDRLQKVRVGQDILEKSRVEVRNYSWAVLKYHNWTWFMTGQPDKDCSVVAGPIRIDPILCCCSPIL